MSPTARGASAPVGAGRLSLPAVLAFSSTGVPVTVLALALGVFLPRYFAGHIGISLVAVGAAFTIVRLIDIAFDPFIGAVMDRTRTPIGRYRPWMIAGVPVMMLGVYKLFNPPVDAGEGYLILWLLVIYAALSILTLAHAAWAAAIATNYHDRSRVYGWMHAVGVAGSVGLLLLPVLTGGRIEPGTGESMPTIGWIIIIGIPLTTALCVLFSPEKVAPKTARETFDLKEYWQALKRPEMVRLIAADLALALGPGTTAAIYVFFFHDAKGFSYAQTSILLVPFIGAGLLGAPVWAAIAQRFGKHQTLMGAAVCYAVFQTILMAIPKALFVPTAIGMFAVGFTSSAFILLVRAMVADVGDAIRLEQGKEQVGLLYAMVTSTQKVGAAISVGIIFPVLSLVGYNAADNAVNTPEAIFGLEMCYLFAPIVFVLVGGACFFGYGLNAERHAQIREELDARDRAVEMEEPITETVTLSATLPDVPVEPRAQPDKA